MIGMAKACIGGAALANYVMQPQKGYELVRNGVSGLTPSEIMEEMKVIQELNQRAEKRTFSLVLSPEKKEGWKLTENELRAMALQFMKKLGIDPEQQQFIAFVHTEKDHKHIHIIANRVTAQGKLLSDHFIGKRAQWAAHEIAKAHGLISAKEKQIEKIISSKEKNEELKSIKEKIRRKHHWVMQKRPRSVQHYIALMRKLDVQVIPVFGRFSGRLQGLRMKDLETGKDFKASEVHRSMSLNKIMEAGIPFKDHEEIKVNLPQKVDSSIHTSIEDISFGSVDGGPSSAKRKRKNENDYEIER